MKTIIALPLLALALAACEPYPTAPGHPSPIRRGRKAIRLALPAATA